MDWIKLSNYSHLDDTQAREKAIRSDMEKLEKAETPWGIEIDKDDVIIGFWDFFLAEDDRDFEYLTDIKVTGGSKYHSADGWLLNDRDEVVFVPKSKRTCLPDAAISSVDNYYDSVWNNVCSLLIRDNLQSFLSDDSHRQTFEEILLLYPKNIVESLIMVALDNHKKCPNLPVEKIEISDDIVYHTYSLLSDDLAQLHDFIGRRNNDNHRNISAKELLQPFDTIVYGQYSYKEKKIILYVKAMTLSRKTGKDLEDLFIGTFVHELVHAYQYGLKKTRGIFKHPIIIESLASYLEYWLYNRILDNSAAGDRLLQSWNWHSVLIYPYSGAKTLMNKARGMKSKPIGIAGALHKLLPREIVSECNRYDLSQYETTTGLIEFFELFKSSPEIAETLLLGETIREEFP